MKHVVLLFNAWLLVVFWGAALLPAAQPNSTRTVKGLDLPRAGTFHCKVNGKNVDLAPYNCYRRFYGTFDVATSILHLHSRLEESEIWLEIKLEEISNNLPVVLSFQSSEEMPPFKAFYMPSGPERSYFVSKSGKVTLTKLDLENHFVSGVFEFTGGKFDPADPLKVFPGEKIIISEGRFEEIHFRSE